MERVTMLEYYRFKVIRDLFLKGQVEEACIQLRELQKRYVNLCDENSAYKAQIREYEDILYLARNFVFDGVFYWLITGSIKQGPFCPNCYNRDGQLVRITDMRPKRCAMCGEVFEMPASGKRSAGGNTARALEQASAMESLRAMAALEQLAQTTIQSAESDPEAAERPQTARAKILQLAPRERPSKKSGNG